MNEPNDDTPKPEPTLKARASASAPTVEQLDVWIGQNKKLIRWSRASMAAIAIAFAIAVGTAVSNVLVLDKLDERGAANREVILGIQQGVDNTQKLLDFTGRLESPEARAESDRKTQELLDALTQRVDCNTRLALLDAVVDVFGRAAADSYRQKIDALCAQQSPTSSGTTTPPTTTPPPTSLVPGG